MSTFFTGTSLFMQLPANSYDAQNCVSTLGAYVYLILYVC